MSRFHIRAYWQSYVSVKEKDPAHASLLEYMTCYPAWRKSIEDAMRDKYCLPWLPFSLITWLQSRIKPTMRVFEYGSGGSTLFFSTRVQFVASVDHNAEWSDRIRNLLNKMDDIGQCHLSFCPPDSSGGELDKNTYCSGDEDSKGMVFKSYVNEIHNFDSVFDIILIDGRARVACIHEALQKINPHGGLLILDDADRDRYKAGINEIPDCFTRQDFWGPRPYSANSALCSVWQGT